MRLQERDTFQASANIGENKHLFIIGEKIERDTDVLSAREREVLELATEGKTAQETALVLQIAPETVRTHMRNLRKKLNATSQAHAVALAAKKGIINLRAKESS